MIDGEAADLRPGDFGEQEDTANRSFAGDAGAGDGGEVLPGGFDNGEEADVGGAIAEPFGTLGGKTEREVSGVFLRTL
jgi:hypothetical protein